ncbi:MAG: chemotaxis response regulator protein-glutamate methylesterase [SAR324 cluster bacterium]|nr:chemotaxis response regulator protein-glutamate methylesterase [SAR324 cluster bacterium]
MKLRALVVDDSILFRQVISDVLTELDHVEVIGTASNGSIGLKRIEQFKPDLVTLDIEMPEMDGLTALKEITRKFPQTKVIMLSALTKQGAKVTIEALASGAFDFIEKPDSQDPEESEKLLKRQLKRIINILVTREILNSEGKSVFTQTASVSAKVKSQSTEDVLQRINAIHAKAKIGVVAIGISTGGPGALPVLLAKFPRDLNVPILIVQHMPALFVTALVDSLNRISPFPVSEAQTEEQLKPNHIYIAPGGKQMKVLRKPGRPDPVIALTDDPPENFCKPSVDYMFRSLSSAYGPRTLAVIMTGMGRDGTSGLQTLKQQNATVFAQDEASSVVFGMAMEAIKANVVDETFPLDQLAQAIHKRVKQY